MFENHLNTTLIFPNLISSDKNGVLAELAKGISSSIASLSMDEIEKALLEREKIDSTAVEEGVAVPHAKISGIDKPILAVGKSLNGINFNSLDQRPTRLFFVLLAPLHSVGDHMKLLARLAKILSMGDIKEKLFKARSSQDIYDVLIESERKI